MKERADTSRIVLVVGAGAGIGVAVASTLAARGATVIATHHRRPPASELSAIEGLELSPADVSTPDGVRALVDGVVAKYGRIDAVVSTVAISEFRPLEAVDHDLVLRHIAINAESFLFLAKYAAPHFPATGGSMVAFSSGASRYFIATGAVYSASKAALEALVRCLAAELGSRKIRVNAIAPGFVDTEHLRTTLPPDFVPRILQRTAMGRLGTPADYGPVVAFLLSDDSSWITGQILNVDGGYS